ncbi:hypothetical protein BS50DRAFT_678252 [Corynespora cassiicola Philippines]|uniref:PLC-like phosphodiesterase n=1 Tax=Corynespora cassiicola Philippines TaxID=1448308 RepID=A0A2T2NJW1_CORCC|nr:hypothetical protein BS50DRAFT_678252 [Corynespora cassiicola Philippines]
MLATFLMACILSAFVSADRTCNNSPDLCSRPYDRILHLGAHNSPFIRNISTSFSTFGNQFFNTTTQLDAGVRLLTGQVHVAENSNTTAPELHMCHSVCQLFDAGLLRDWLGEIRTWMDKNPNEVVTIVLVNAGNVSAAQLEAEYSRAGIAHYGYAPLQINKPPPPSNDTHRTWPTLEEMIDKGDRLVNFVSPLTTDQDKAPYLLAAYDFYWENNYQITNASDFSCTPHRPDNTTSASVMLDSGRLFFMNHFLYWQQAFGIQVPDIRNIYKTNSFGAAGSTAGLGQHLINCSDNYTRTPSFVLVDFFNVGPAIEVVDIFNKVRQPVGRAELEKGVVEGAGLRQQMMVSGASRAGKPRAILGLVIILAAGWT